MLRQTRKQNIGVQYQINQSEELIPGVCFLGGNYIQRIQFIVEINVIQKMMCA